MSNLADYQRQIIQIGTATISVKKLKLANYQQYIIQIGRLLATKYPNWQIISDKISKLADFQQQIVRIGRFLASNIKMAIGSIKISKLADFCEKKIGSLATKYLIQQIISKKLFKFTDYQHQKIKIGKLSVTNYPNWQIISDKISKLADFQRQ